MQSRGRLGLSSGTRKRATIAALIAASSGCAEHAREQAMQTPGARVSKVQSTPTAPAQLAGAKASTTPTTADSAPAPGPSATRIPGSGDYPWLALDAIADSLEKRIAAPAGFTRVSVAPKSFAEFLRGLPMTAPGTPVTSYRGAVLIAAQDPRLAAVVKLDIGTADLQQCADSIIRLHAEWRYAHGARDQSYRAVSGDVMDFARYSKGQRAHAEGNKLVWQGGAKADDSHASFRNYLDTVFSYASTLSLARTSSSPERADLRAGDFWVMGGAPGHTVLLLDVAKDASGHLRGLIGQGYMPAQSFQVLANAGDPWFSLDEEAVSTPHWQPFPWSSLRRLPE